RRSPGNFGPARRARPVVSRRALDAGSDVRRLRRAGIRQPAESRVHHPRSDRPPGRHAGFRRARAAGSRRAGQPRRLPVTRRRGVRSGAQPLRPRRLPASAGRRVLSAGKQPRRTRVNVLFIHDAFPAQFGLLALELTRRLGWRCSFLVQSLSSCPAPTQEMVEKLDLHPVPLAAEHRSSDGIPWPQIYGHFLEQCRAVHDALRARPHLKPDLVVAHGGRGAPTLFLREVIDCPIVVYCEYYFAMSHGDISYRIDLPPAEPAQFFPRSINAPTLAALVDCDAGYSATHWQKQTFPRRFQSN